MLGRQIAKVRNCIHIHMQNFAAKACNVTLALINLNYRDSNLELVLLVISQEPTKRQLPNVG